MRKVELLPTWNSEAGYAPGVNCILLSTVAYRTSLEMSWDVKPHFSQLLKAHVQDGRSF